MDESVSLRTTTTAGAATPAADLVAALGRLLLSAIFIQAGINKMGTLAHTAAEMGSHGIPDPNLLVWGAIAVELIGGLMLLTGLLARWAALVLFFYTLALAVIFHAYWAAPANAAGTQHAFFFGHLSMMGGMLYVVAFGAGAFSLDALMARRTVGAAYR